MATPSETGRILAELKQRTGLSWPALADTLGISSGDYARKVASGAKPGRNIAAVVREAWETGEVTKAVPRRRDASGRIARVRASRTMTGQPSRRPAETALRAPSGARRLFATGDGRMGWAQAVPASDGTVDAGDVMDAVRAAGRGRRRVHFRVQVRPRPGAPAHWVTIGEKGGYTPRDVLARMRQLGVEGWLHHQTAGRAYVGTGGLMAVEVIAE